MQLKNNNKNIPAFLSEMVNDKMGRIKLRITLNEVSDII
jgi:hypothetical protein